jgi:2-dehydro-3-deoxygluconokinase
VVGDRRARTSGVAHHRIRRIVTHVLVVGEPLVELLEGEPGVVRRGFGGDALNVAVYLCRESPELRVSLGSAVGDDRRSRELIDMCRSEGVDVSFLPQVGGSELGEYIVTVDHAGERSFRYRRADSPFRAVLDVADHPLPEPATVDALWFSGIGLAMLHEAGRERMHEYASSVRHGGGSVIYDPNHRPALWASPGEARAWTSRVAGSADIVLASVDDGRLLTGATTARDVADAFRALGSREVVITDGSAPCVVARNTRVIEVPANEALIVDTTAAGDAFDAGYMAARLGGEDPEGSARAGHRLASMVVTYRGALIPRRS